LDRVATQKGKGKEKEKKRPGAVFSIAETFPISLALAPPAEREKRRKKKKEGERLVVDTIFLGKALSSRLALQPVGRLTEEERGKKKRRRRTTAY